ncbi:hypothetical protein FH972_019033 [Carpinus fangiana]|uniref:Cupin type-1 domain-containing protein n=1 Tax=Carpinus fangiana TaxID=176857 RepID=A0A5N6RSE1_9ROSI|nr:hypothetical protein FH972_019033 [Carpinus fangiana]
MMKNLSTSPFCMLSCLIVLLALPLPSLLADPDSLQDFCVADLGASASVNGFPCKPASKVTSDDFFFDGLSKEGAAVVPLNLFASTPLIPNDVLTKTFQVGDDVVNSIKSKFSS